MSASLRERCRAAARQAVRPYAGDPIDAAADAAMRVTVGECVEIVLAAAEVPADMRVMLAARIRALLDEGGTDAKA